jgi:hypothetical protein
VIPEQPLGQLGLFKLPGDARQQVVRYLTKFAEETREDDGESRSAGSRKEEEEGARRRRLQSDEI